MPYISLCRLNSVSMKAGVSGRGSFQMTGIGRAEGMVFKERCVEITVQ